MDEAAIDRDAVQRFWDGYRQAAGGPETPPLAFWFGDSEEMADELADLVTAGTKRATAGLVRDVGSTPTAVMPHEGMLSIVVDGQGRPRCLIRTTQVRTGRFDSVDAQFAWDEGEGDRTLAWWLEGHRAFFRRDAARRGLGFDDAEETIFERFTVIWPPDLAD